MILDQNTIVLNPCNGFYDEYKLVSDEQASKASLTRPVCVLPGAVVGQVTVDPIFNAKKYPFYAPTPGTPVEEAEKKFKDDLAIAKAQNQAVDYATATTVPITFGEYIAKYGGTSVTVAKAGTEGADFNYDGGAALDDFYAKYPRQHVITAGKGGTATPAQLDEVEVLILVENALLGKGICALYFPGEVTPVYSPVSGDRYLGRCVPGKYTEGEPLYLCDYAPDTDNQLTEDGYSVRGFYFCGKDYVGRGNEIKAFAGEDFICPGATNKDRKPYPFFLDVVDDSTTERPATNNINGALTNLLRVRMA